MTGIAPGTAEVALGIGEIAPGTAEVALGIGEIASGPPGIVLGATVGGSRHVAVLALAGLLVAAVMSLAVVSRLVAGYRRNGSGAMLTLGVGLALLVTGPIFLRLAFANLVAVSPVARSLATTGSELLGLAAILYAIYDP